MNAKRDENRVTTILGTSSTDAITPIPVYADPTTHRLLVDIAASAAQIAAHFQVDQFTSTNNQTQFLASQTIVLSLLMVVNGQAQAPTFDYTIVGNTYTLGAGIPSGLQVLLIYIY